MKNRQYAKGLQHDIVGYFNIFNNSTNSGSQKDHEQYCWTVLSHQRQRLSYFVFTETSCLCAFLEYTSVRFHSQAVTQGSQIRKQSTQVAQPGEKKVGHV